MSIPSRPKSVRTSQDTSFAEVALERTADIPVAAVRSSPFQIRQSSNAEHIAALAQSVADIDLSSPILVRPVENGLFELVCGEHRWRAYKQLGRSTIRATIRQMSDESAAKTLIADNLQHLHISDWEVFIAIKLLFEKAFASTDAEVAQLIGRPRTYVTKVRAFDDLSHEAKDVVRSAPHLFGSNLVADLRSKDLNKKHPALVLEALRLVTSGALTQSGVVPWIRNKNQPHDSRPLKDSTNLINNKRVRVTVYQDTIRIHCPGMNPVQVEESIQKLLSSVL